MMWYVYFFINLAMNLAHLLGFAPDHYLISNIHGTGIHLFTKKVLKVIENLFNQFSNKANNIFHLTR